MCRGWAQNDDVESINKGYYLYINVWYRFFSPTYWSNNGYVSVMTLLENGRINSDNVLAIGGVQFIVLCC